MIVYDESVVFDVFLAKYVDFTWVNRCVFVVGVFVNEYDGISDGGGVDDDGNGDGGNSGGGDGGGGGDDGGGGVFIRDSD